MSWKVQASNGGGQYEKPPAGNHPAVLVGLIDLGHQWQDGFQGADGRHQHRLYFVYELVTKKMTGKVNENHLVAIDLTLSFNEKAKLRKWVESRLGRKMRDGEAYDVTDELGKPVCVLVTANDKGYTKIEGVSAVPEGLSVPPPLRKPVAWKLGDPFEALPSWLPYLYGRDIPTVIRDSEEMKGRTEPAGNPVGQSQPQQAPHQPAPTSPPPAAAGGFRRPAPKPEIPPPPTDGSVWWVWDDTQNDWGPLTAKEIIDYCEEAKLQKYQVKVYPDGKSPAEAKTADLYGFPATTPF